METTNQTNIAAILGISPRQVRNLVKEGIIVKRGEEYPIKESVDRYTAFKEERPVPYQYRSNILENKMKIRLLCKSDLTLNDFEVPFDLKEKFDQELISVNTANQVLYDFARDILGIVETECQSEINALLDKHYFTKEIMQDTLEFMIEDLEEKNDITH